MRGLLGICVHLSVALALAAAPAEARTMIGGTAFGAGLLEPVRVLEHLLGLLAIGLWAARIGGPAVWQVPAAALTAALAAGLAGALGLRLPYADEGLAASLAVMGVLVAAGVRAPVVVAVLAAAAAALFHGYLGLNGPALAWAGFMASALLLTSAGLGLAVVLGQGLSPRAVGACGAGVAVAGLIDLADALLPGWP